MSTPHPSRPEDIKNARLAFRSWIKDLKSENKGAPKIELNGRGLLGASPNRG